MFLIFLKRLKQKELLMVYMMGEATPKKVEEAVRQTNIFFAQTFVDIVYRNWLFSALAYHFDDVQPEWSIIKRSEAALKRKRSVKS